MSGRPRVITDENGVRIVIPPLPVAPGPVIGPVTMGSLPSETEADAAIAADPTILQEDNLYEPTPAEALQLDSVSGVVDDPNGPPSPEQVANRALWAQREADKKRMRRERLASPEAVPVAATPVVRTSASGAPVVGTPAEAATPPAPETTEELQARLAAEELANVDNPALLPEVAQARIKNLQEQGMSEAEAMKGVAELRAQHADQMEANAQRINAAMDEAIERHRVAQEDMRARADALYATRFEPRRIFSSPDAAANVGVHLGVAVGAMLQSFQNVHFPGSNAANTALSIVDRAIEADIAQQREAFSRGEGQLRQDSAAMEAMNRLGVQEVDALMFTRMAATEQVAEQLSSLAAAHAGTAAGQRFEQAALAMRERYMMLRGQLDAQAMQQAALNARTGRGGRARGREDSPVIFGDIRDDAMHADGAYFENSDDPRVVQRQMAYARDEATQRKVSEAGNASEELQKTLQEIDGMFQRGELGGATIDSGARNSAEVLTTFALVMLKEAYRMGTLDEGSIEVASRILGNPDDVFTRTSSYLARLRRAISQVKSYQNTVYRSHGISVRHRGPSNTTTEEFEQNRVIQTDDEPPTNYLTGQRENAAPGLGENVAANVAGDPVPLARQLVGNDTARSVIETVGGWLRD